MPLIFTAVVIAVFFLVFLTFPMSAPGTKLKLVSELVRQYGMVGSYDQRTAFVCSLIAICIFSWAAFLVGKSDNVTIKLNSFIPDVSLWLALLITIVGLAIYSRLLPMLQVSLAAALACGFFIFVLLARYIPRRPFELVLLALIGAYVALVVVPGLLVWPVPFAVNDPGAIAQLELHLLALVQPGSAIAAGQKLFREIPFSYGLLMPSMISVIESRIVSLTVGDHVRFVQYCQIAFSFTAVAAYFCYRPRNYLGILAALLLAAPYWSSAGLGIWHPNQTGMRSLTLPLGILALTLLGRLRPNLAAWSLGAIGMIALLINVETTVAVGVGFIVYFSLRTRGIPYAAVARMSTSAAVIFCAYLLCYRFALGRLPFGIDLGSILVTLRAHVTGDIGQRLFTAGPWAEGYYIVPFALVMFTHAIYVVIAAYQRLGSGPLSHQQSLKAAIATVLIVWFSYYFNMPNWWQIWTHFFLYGFLLMDLLDLRLFGIGRVWRNSNTARSFDWRLPARLLRIAPLFLLSVVVIHTNSNLAYFTRDFVTPSWMRGDHDASVVSEVLVSRAAANALKEKTTKLRELYDANPGKVRYLTFNVEFVPMMTRIFEPAPFRSLWGSVAGDDALDPSIDELTASHPTAILIDAPTGPLAVTGEREHFQNRVRVSVSRNYHLSETLSGWEIYRPGPAK